MTPAPPARFPLPSWADRLEALADDWQTIATARAARPISTEALDALRAALIALADEAEAGACTSWAGAARRIALLSEVWECLTAEPGQELGATEVAEFCLGAMRHLARGPGDGSP